MSYDPQQESRPFSTPPDAMPPQQFYPASPAPYGYGPPVVLVPQVPSSGYAVWAFVVGLVGFFAGWCMLGVPCIAAVILGHAAVADTRNNAKSGRSMAVAGLALGYVSLAPAIILFFWFGLAFIGGAGGAAVPDPSATPTR